MGRCSTKHTILCLKVTLGTFGRKSYSSIKNHGLFQCFKSSFLTLYCLVSSLSPWPNLYSLRMSQFALIKLFLDSVFKRRGFEEEEHLCATTGKAVEARRWG